MKRFWICWSSNAPSFKYLGPWWIFEHREVNVSRMDYCAAVIAESTEHAEQLVRSLHPISDFFEVHYCTEKPDDWEPDWNTYPRQYWMRWPFVIYTPEVLLTFQYDDDVFMLVSSAVSEDVLAQWKSLEVGTQFYHPLRGICIFMKLDFCEESRRMYIYAKKG